MRDQFQNFQGLGIDRHNLTAVGESDDVEPFFVGRAHCTLDAAVGQEAADDHGLDTISLELLFQICSRKSIEPPFPVHDHVSVLWLHGLAEVRIPGARREELALRAAVQDA